MNRVYVILDTEDKVAKSGKQYLRVKASLNEQTVWMSAFNKADMDVLRESKNKEVELAVDEEANIIRKVERVLRDVEEQTETPKPVTRMSKETTMYTSYAKDLMIAMLQVTPSTDFTKLEDMMNRAISLIINAKDAFS